MRGAYIGPVMFIDSRLIKLDHLLPLRCPLAQRVASLPSKLLI